MSLRSDGSWLVVFSLLILAGTSGHGAAQPFAESTFDEGPAGWTTGGQGTAPQHVATGGRPGGYLEAEAQSDGDVWYWQAPSSFTGDHSAAYNGALRFERIQPATETVPSSPDVILQGADNTLTFTGERPPDSAWAAYRIPLRPSAGWTLQGTEQAPTEAEMKAVLGAIQSLQLRGNYWAGRAAGLDNVRLQAAQTIERWVDPKQTYLQTDLGDGAREAVAINLANLGLSPGDEIHVARLGEFDFDPTEQNTTLTRMVAVFSGSDVLEESGQQDRVPDAIDAGEDFNTGGLSSDIPEDFRVDGDVVEIPQGAAYLFLSPYDSVLGDNADADGDFRLQISIPTVPTGLSAAAPGDSVALQWTASPFESIAAYRVYRGTEPIDSTDGPGAYTALASTMAGDTTYVDASVSVDQTYYYRLTAVDSVGNESALGDQILVTPGRRPSPPSNLTAQAAGDSSVALQWRASEAVDVDRYRLYRDTTSIGSINGLNGRPPVDSTGPGETGYADTRLRPGQTYHYRVTAVDPEGNESVVSTEATARPPRSVLAVGDSGQAVQGGTTTVDVLANDLRGTAALDTASVRVIGEPMAGTTTTNDTTGAVRYTHDGTDRFADAFTYVVEDLENAADTASVALSIDEVTLSAERDSIDVGRAQVGAPAERVRLRFQNTGEAPARGVSLTLSNQSDYAVLDDTGQEVLPPDSMRVVQVGFGPDGIGGQQATDVTLTSETGQRSSVHLMGAGVGVQVEPSLEGDGATRGNPVPISVTPQGPFEPEQRRLFVRPAGELEYREVGDPAQIPGSLVTERGVDYYVALSDGDLRVIAPGGDESVARRNPFHLPVEFDSLSVPVTLPSRTYRMVAVSAQTAFKDALRNRFGPYDRSTWRALRWDPESGAYREYPEMDRLRPGAGLWLITSDGQGLTLGAGRTVDASGPQEVPLQPGWNQVSTPFGFAVPWDTVQVASGLGPSTVGGPVAYRDSAFQRGQTVLRPWEGYFVFNATGSRDTLVVPPVGAASGETGGEAAPKALAGSGLWGGSDREAPVSSAEGRAVESAVSKGNGADASGTTTTDDEPYTLRVTARPEQETPQRVWVGLRAEAQAGRDGLDFAQVPPVDRTTRMSVQETVGGRAVPHTGSFKPPEEEGQAWTLLLERREGEQDGTTRRIRLQMRTEGTLPEGQRRYVLDLDDKTRLTSGQVLALEPGEQRRLKVIVGTKAFANQESNGISLGSFENELRGNVPNPFGQATTLTYVLEEQTEVVLEVYNVLGQRVRTLVQEQRAAGVHHVRWEGENQYGHPVGSGVYFYRIEAGDFRETRKMVLVR